MIKVLFICHGNICRSPMGEFILKDLVRQAGREGEFTIASAVEVSVLAILCALVSIFFCILLPTFLILLLPYQSFS